MNTNASISPGALTIFAQAYSLSEDDRNEFIRKACQGNATLEAEVQSLLKGSQEASGFFEDLKHKMADEVAENPPRDIFQAGDKVDKYAIVCEKGRGGMAVVYEAKRADKTFEHRIALKVIKRGIDTDEVLRRFYYERQILASLNHPNVTAIYDGGVTSESLPYFVMEYIEGQPINAYCAHHQLTIPERLDLFEQVCEAVSYAHQNLIVHRDLKPTNILVTPEGQVKLTDFGIAKLLGKNAESDYTKTGYSPMTPHYAAPEQLNQDPISVQTDVYQLGLLLYELLSRVAPFTEVSSMKERLEGMQNHSLLLPSKVSQEAAVSKLLRGDLDTIVGKALRYAPTDRYGSVADLLRDIRNHRQNRPIRARASSSWYRAKRYAQRNRIPLAATSLIVILTLAFGLIYTLNVARARNEAQKAALEARQEAEKAQQVTNFMTGLFASASPLLESEKDISVRRFLELGAKKTEQELERQPEIKYALLTTLGQAQFDIGYTEDAVQTFRKALKLGTKTYGAEDLNLLEPLVEMGDLAMRANDFEAARQYYSRAEKIAQKSEDSYERSVVSYYQGLLYQFEGDLPASDSLFRRAIRLHKAAKKKNPEFLAEFYTYHGVTLQMLDKADEASTVLKEAIRLYTETKGKNSYEVAYTSKQLAHVWHRQGQYKKAEPLYRASLEINRDFFGPEARITGVDYHDLGLLLDHMGKRAKAEKNYLKAIDIYQKVYSTDQHFNIGVSKGALANLYFKEGKYEQSDKYFEEGLETLLATLGPQHPNMALMYKYYAELLIEMNQLDKAERLLDQAYPIYVGNFGEESWRSQEINRFRGRIAFRRQQWQRAESLYLKVYAVVKKKNKLSDAPVLNILQDIVQLYEKKNEVSQLKKYQKLLKESQEQAQALNDSRGQR